MCRVTDDEFEAVITMAKEKAQTSRSYRKLKARDHRLSLITLAAVVSRSPNAGYRLHEVAFEASRTISFEEYAHTVIRTLVMVQHSAGQLVQPTSAITYDSEVMPPLDLSHRALLFPFAITLHNMHRRRRFKPKWSVCFWVADIRAFPAWSA
jgi:hypothetical protein